MLMAMAAEKSVTNVTAYCVAGDNYRSRIIVNIDENICETTDEC